MIKSLTAFLFLLTISSDFFSLFRAALCKLLLELCKVRSSTTKNVLWNIFWRLQFFFLDCHFHLWHQNKRMHTKWHLQWSQGSRTNQSQPIERMGILELRAFYTDRQTDRWISKKMYQKVMQQHTWSDQHNYKKISFKTEQKNQNDCGATKRYQWVCKVARTRQAYLRLIYDTQHNDIQHNDA